MCWSALNIGNYFRHVKKISQREITPNLIKQWKDFLTYKMRNEKGKIHLKVKTIILIY